MLDSKGRRYFTYRAVPINEKPPPANAQQKAMQFDQVGDAYLWAQTFGEVPGDVPELNLRRAMLTQAWNDLHHGHRYPSLSVIERLVLRAWVDGCFESGQPYHSPVGYSFVEVCDALGLEPDSCRRALYARKPPAHNTVREVIVNDMMRRKSPLNRRGKLRKRTGRESDRRAHDSGTLRGRASEATG